MLILKIISNVRIDQVFTDSKWHSHIKTRNADLTKILCNTPFPITTCFMHLCTKVEKYKAPLTLCILMHKQPLYWLCILSSGHITSPMLDFFSSLRLFIVNEQKVKKLETSMKLLEGQINKLVENNLSFFFKIILKI